MASIEQAPPPPMGAGLESNFSPANPLDSLLARVYTVNWEAVFYLVLFIAAVLTRFVNLGDRVMSHDESLHTKFSFDLWKNGNFQHTPLMHGPLIFHAAAFSYFLFGDSDFSARLYPAILGIMMVMMPKFLFERWLGKLGAMVATVLMLISPMILYHNRYIREDTPSIFFTLVMLYAVMRYVDGVQPRQFRWLVVLSGATLLGLASKEVAFMYILFFAAFLTLFWLVQVLGGTTRGEVKPIAGQVLAIILAAGAIGGVAFVVGGALGNALNLPRILFQGVLFLAFGAIAYSFLKPIRSVLDALGDRAQTTFRVITMGTSLGVFMSLALICFVNIIKLDDVTSATNPNASSLMANLVVWIAALVGISILTVVATAMMGFWRQRQLPWLEIGAMFVIAFGVAALFVFAEERSKFSSTEHPSVPNAILVAWVLGALATIGLLYLRFLTRFFQEMRRYPVFDVLVVMGTLVLPWITALPMWLQGYKLDDNYASPELVQAGIAAAIPFIVVAVVGGLCWNPRVWVVCAVTFYGIFAFFFTTIFSNPTGIISGAIGSLGYWLEQQGVRRGSQPQYYYMLVQMPVYEFLPMFGAVCAGIAGLLAHWRFRATRYAAAIDGREALRQPIEAESDEQEAMIREERRIGIRNERWDAEALDRFPMISFLAFWTVMIIYLLTLSGEKMPWLTTHIAAPMVLVTGWFVGRLLEKVDWPAFFRQSWSLILLTPVLLIGVGALVSPFAFGQSPIGLQREQLLTFGSWLFAGLITAGSLYGVWFIMRRVGWRETVRVMFVGVFILLGLLTARAAWRFAYIDYDYATEFGVYAHGAPAVKTVMDRIEELSKATTDSMNLKVAYDNDTSWPGSWYFRNYPNARFLGDAAGATDLDQMAAIVVSSGHRGNVEPQLGDNYYKYDYIRLWWPMQDYFDLNANRVNNLLIPVEGGIDPGKLRQGLWDIWWNRDYKSYGTATGKNFDTNQWPVADRMVFFVRKDIAAQVWNLGVGNVAPVATVADPFLKLRCNDCRADLAIGALGAAPAQLNNPHGIEIGPDGNLYVADTQNGRISVFNADGQFIRVIGTATTIEGNTGPTGTLRQPWSVAVGKDGTVYVADTWNHRVQIFDAQGQFVRAVGRLEQVAGNQQGSTEGFWGPRDIAVDGLGNFYVVDTGNKRIRVYDPNGALIRSIGTPGAGPGQLNEPVGIAIDNNAGRMYIADTWNKRIQVFTLEGAPIVSWKVPNWYSPSDDNTGNRPYLTLDKAGGRLFAAEPDTGRILVWDISTLSKDGGEVPLIVFGSKGAGDTNRFVAVGGLTVNDGSLFVADAGAGRILRFALDALPNFKPAEPLKPLLPQFTNAEPTNVQPTDVQPTNGVPTNVEPTVGM